VIRSFKDSDAEAIFHEQFSRRLQRIAHVAFRRLTLLDAAHTLDDLRRFPGHRLEALAGDRQGQHSIRINDQYRICFVWQSGDAPDVEIVDYH
jgi:proteic killer suppression protein